MARNVSAAAIETSTVAAAINVSANTHESRFFGISRILFDLEIALG
jgi:hypothetical protein